MLHLMLHVTVSHWMMSQKTWVKTWCCRHRRQDTYSQRKITSHTGHLVYIIIFFFTIQRESEPAAVIWIVSLSIIKCSCKLCVEWLFPSEGLPVLCGGSTSKIEVLVPSAAQIMKEGSSVRAMSLILTPHVVVIRSADSCVSSEQINIYYSHSSVQLRGLMTPLRLRSTVT